VTAIGGYWARNSAAEAQDRLEAILAAQTMFGPHGTATARFAGIALGRNLYRLLPEDVHDRQPERHGDLALVADVRLDNRDELVAELALESASSDAGVLLHALAAWGEGALGRLVGAFAFALWDAATERLTLARDPMGQRPLYYHRDGQGFAFATMPRGLLALPGVPTDPDERQAARFLALMPETGSATFYRALQRVVPGECVVVTHAGEVRRRYWNPPGPAPERASFARDGEHHAEVLRREFDRAVAACLRGADGRVGAQLSGGVDSSAVTATAARLLAETGGKVIAFTAVPQASPVSDPFPGRIADEGPMAAMTSAMYPNVESVRVRSGDVPPTALLEWDFALHERPSLNPFNMVWIDAINAAASTRKLSILLTGQMGNLTISFPGWERIDALVTSGRLPTLVSLAASLISRGETSPLALALRVWSAVTAPFVPSAWRRQRAVERTLSLSAIKPDLLRSIMHRELPARRGDPAAMRLQALQSLDPGNFNKAVLAQYGIDTRDPTADRRVIELCLSLPLSAYLDKGRPRRLARNLVRGAVPAALLAERRKGVQASDWHVGMKAAQSDIRREVSLMAGSPAVERVVDVPRLDTMLAEWPEEWGHPATMRDYRLVFQRALAVGHFLRRAEQLATRKEDQAAIAQAGSPASERNRHQEDGGRGRD